MDGRGIDSILSHPMLSEDQHKDIPPKPFPTTTQMTCADITLHFKPRERYGLIKSQESKVKKIADRADRVTRCIQKTS
jgi:hypothetical protein